MRDAIASAAPTPDRHLARGPRRRTASTLADRRSNDSWFARGGGPRLHLVVSAFRSLETRRAQVRATNTGISAIISPTGEILASLGVHRRGTAVAGVPLESRRGTLVLAWGEWLGPCAFAALGVGLVAAAVCYRRSP